MNPTPGKPHLGELLVDADSGLSYRVRQPQPQEPTRCVILLHGVGGNESNLLDLAEGLDANTLVLFVRGPLQLGPQQFAWFRVAFTAAGPSIVAEEAERSRATLIHFGQHQRMQRGIAANQTVIAGFSQGGILSASVALTAPEAVAAFAVLSGRILPELKPHLASATQLAGLKAFIGHGTHDSKLPLHWAERADAWLCELGVEHALRLYPMDHGISGEMHQDFMDWIAALA